jgi:hypothetical protein
VQLEGLGQLKKIPLIGTRTHDLSARSIVPQPTTLPHAPSILKGNRLVCLCLCEFMYYIYILYAVGMLVLP